MHTAAVYCMLLVVLCSMNTFPRLTWATRCYTLPISTVPIKVKLAAPRQQVIVRQLFMQRTVQHCFDISSSVQTVVLVVMLLLLPLFALSNAATAVVSMFSTVTLYW
jgi:hypothetical protein